MSGVAGTVTETVNRITGSASRGTVDAQGFQVAHGTTIHRGPGRARAFPRTPPLEQESGSVRDEPIERIMLALGGGGGVTADEPLGGGLKKVDFTESLFFNEIYHTLRKGPPYRIPRRANAPPRRNRGIRVQTQR